MKTWPDEAARELEAELRRLNQDSEVKQAQLQRAQADYEAVNAERVKVHDMLEWVRQRQSQPVAEPLEHGGGSARGGGGGAGLLRWDANEILPAEAAKRSEQAAEVDTAESDAAQNLNQAELCKRELVRIGHPAETTEIRKRLEQQGYTLNQGQVRSSLKYLARKKVPEVESIRPGVWRLLGDPGQLAPFGSEAVPALNGTRGNR